MLQRAAPDPVNAPPRSILGAPGSIYVNDTPKILYQLHVRFENSCAVCVQFANRIGTWWAIPFHPGCNCLNVPIPPGMRAAPFIDYVEAVSELDPAQQARVMGAGNWQLVRSGAVRWEDVVTRSRIRPLHEVADRAKLSLDDLVRAGLGRARAEAAMKASRTPARASAESARQEAVARLRSLGLTTEEIRAGLRDRLKGRVVRTGGPTQTGPRRFTPPPPPAAPPPAPAPAPAPKPAPKFGPSKARVRVLDPDAEFTAEDAARHVGKMVGRDVTTEDLASLVGATDASIVNIVDAEAGKVTIRVRGGGFESERVIKLANGKPVIKNESFYVDEGRTGQGLGYQVFGRQVETASRLGFAELQTEAAGFKGAAMNGYYTWPRFGYDGPIPGIVKVFMPKEYAGMTRVSEILKTPGGKEWWKENGNATSMAFDLAEGSHSRRVWDGYQAEREAR